MKSRLMVIVLILASLLPAVVAVAQAPPASDESVERIIVSALGPSPLEGNLRRLTDSMGGSPAAMREADVVDVEAGDEAGFAAVGERARGALVLVHSRVIQDWAD